MGKSYTVLYSWPPLCGIQYHPHESQKSTNSSDQKTKQRMSKFKRIWIDLLENKDIG